MEARNGWQRAACALLMGLGIFGAAHAQQFEVIAGGALGDGGPATEANLNGAADLRYDAAGVLFVTQTEGNRIRAIATDGTISTVVGGKRGFSGDGGAASEATIDGPRGLVFDAGGNLYFSDAGNHRVRRIASDGTITTYAGNGSATFSGDGGPATSAGLVEPAGLAFDITGNLFIADKGDHRVRKVATDGTITTVAGTGIRGNGGMYGPATSANLNGPQGVLVDVDGRFYIADTGNLEVRLVYPDGTMSSYWFYGYMAGPTYLAMGPYGVFFADNGRCQLYEDYQWVYAGKAGCNGYGGDGIAPGLVGLNRFGGITFDALGQVAFVDASTSQIRKFVDNGAGGVKSATIAGRGADIQDGDAALGAPLSNGAAIAIEANGDVLVAESDDNRRVRRITRDGAVYTIAGNGRLAGSFGSCQSFPCDALVAALEQMGGIAVSADGEIYLGDSTTQFLYQLRGDGMLDLMSSQPPSSDYPSNFPVNDGDPVTSAYVRPAGLALDAAGNLYIADEGFDRIRKVATNGIITTIAGTGYKGFSGDNGPANLAKIDAPKAVAVDALGNVYFSDSGNRRIRRIAPNGVITTVAGNGQMDVSGDGGAPTAAAVGIVHGLAVGANNVLWFTSNGRLRYIANNVVRSVANWTTSARGLAYRNGYLVVSTQEGLVYRAMLGRQAHDYDANGRADILWHNNTTGANTIWKGANNLTQQAVTTVTGTAWKIVGQGDFDGDLRSDIVWRNVQTGANAIWKSGISTTQINMTGVTNQAWSIVGVGDFNRDGKSDLLWRNATTGENTIWRSGIASTQIAMFTASVQWKVAGVADFDGDGVADVLWRNATTGANSIWRSGLATTAQAVTTVPIAWKAQGVGDFNGDGRADIFWRNANGQNVIWNSADSRLVRTLITVATVWKPMAVGDYDGDGKADLLWRNTNTGANTYWRGGEPALAQPLVGVTGAAWTIVPYEFQP